MQEISELEKKIKLEVEMKSYSGADRVVYADDKLKEIEEERKHKPAFAAFTGWGTFDAQIDGFRKGQLIVLSGPPKNGKSQFCAAITARLWNKYKCVWFQYELNYEEFLARFPKNSENKLDFYLPNYMESGNLEWIEKRIVEAKEKHGIEIVFIDHLDFLRDVKDLRNVSMNLSTYVGGIVQKVKQLAIKHEVVIFLMTHIRKNEWTKDSLPNSEELRDSGQIAQLADIVLMIIRRRSKEGDEVYHPTGVLVGEMENRHNGKTKKISMT